MDEKIHKIAKSKNKRGRPSKQAAVDIDNQLRKYFQEGYSAYGVYLKTGMEMRTILPRYNKWLDELEDKSDFIQRQIDAKTSFLSKLDYARNKHKEYLDFIEEKIRTAKKVSKNMLRDRSSILSLLNSVDREIFDVSTKPVIKDKLEEYISGKIEEAQKQLVEIGIKNEIQ